MNLINKVRTFNFTTTGIRVFGLLCLMAGLLGSLIQARVLGTGTMTNSQLFDLLETNPTALQTAGFALALQAMEACAVPLFAFLLVEGAHHTSDFGKYFLRVLGLAVVCQLPYNLFRTGSLLMLGGLNPVFALVMSMVMLYFFRRYPEKKLANVGIKALAIIGTFLWSNMLGVSHGAVCVLLTAVLWALHGKTNLQTFVGMMVSFACCIFSLFYMATPLSFLVLHFYEGEEGSSSRIVNYAAYPVMLVVAAVLMLLR